ncbi:MAG: recombinase family protein, partial [Defluviitaleaceae bacterium]|nr:recombinase family protein [Defluviitaleaceae bacterium]
IETQQAIIKAYIDERPDLELTDIYIDNGLSGQSFQRPAFTQMLEALENGKINCCISKDLSRLGRNAIDTGYYIEKFFPTNGIRYIAITDDYDSADPNSGGVMVNLKNMVNEHFALEIGRKIRQTKQMNIRKGKFVGRLAPYGYMKSAEDKHQLVHDPYAAPIVLRMYEMAASGNSVTEILEWLNAAKILPPKRYYHSKGLATDRDIEGTHTQWNKGGIYTILKNRVYCGDMVQGKYQTRSYVQKSVQKSDWVIVENTHAGIVSHELFERVQLLWENSVPRAKCTPFPENIFLRKIFCGHCGYALKRARRKGGDYDFVCNSRQVYSKDACVPISISENDLKESLLKMLEKQAEVLGIESADTHQHPEQQGELRQIQAEIEKNNRFLKSLYESLASNDITKEEYRELKVGYEEKISALTAKEKALREEMIAQIAKNSAKTKAAKRLANVRRIADLTAESIDKLVEKILVFEESNIEVWFKFTDGMVASTEGGECDACSK